MKSFLGRIGNLTVFLIIAYASYLLILLSLPYIHFEPGVDFLETKQLIYHIDIWRYSFYIHVFTSPLVIICGLLQFSTYLLREYPNLHKWLGKVYIVVLLFITGPAAFIMSLYANGGRITQTSFVILSSLWIVSTFLAYSKIRSGNVSGHVKWMIRSYALTLSAVTLRFYAYLFDIFKIPLNPIDVYTILAYISWIPNIIFAEILIRVNYHTRLIKAIR